MSNIAHTRFVVPSLQACRHFCKECVQTDNEQFIKGWNSRRHRSNVAMDRKWEAQHADISIYLLEFAGQCM